jgi:membrane protein
MIRMLRRTVQDWLDDDCPRMAAALSYYTVFSLPPLLVLVLMLVGVFVDPAAVEGRIFSEIGDLIGAGAAEQVRGMVENVTRPGSGGPLVVVLGVLGLLLGATGALAQLQTALNRAWEVEPDPDRGGWKNVVRKRILSLGMILTLAFLLLVSLVASAAVGAFGETVAGALPGALSGAFLTGLDLVLSLAVATVLFAAIFVVLPDAEVAWRDVWVGALGTAVLFTAGRFLLGLWLGRSDPGAAYGAAGSLALILIWIYYSAMIFFLGAEFTQAWATERGAGIKPEEGAVRVVTETRHVRPGEGEAPAEA